MAQSSDKHILRLYEPNDYELFKLWYEYDGSTVPPVSSLPRAGFVIEKKLIGFLADTDCDFMICTWYCVNPLSSMRGKYNALKYYFKACTEAAFLMKKKQVFCYATHSGIIRMLESLDFKNVDQSGHMVKEV